MGTYGNLSVPRRTLAPMHLASALSFWTHAIWHPLKGDGYQFWSGVGSGSPLFVLAYATWRRHNCHVRWCPRIIWKADGEHHVCRRHHSDTPPAADWRG